MAIELSDEERAKIVLKRADESQAFFSRTARHSWLRWVSLSFSQLLCAAAIPVVSAVSVADATAKHTMWSIITAILGSAIAVFRGVDGLAQNHDTWLRARATEQSLIQAKVAFESRTSAFANSPDVVDAYSARVEQILNGELQNWVAEANAASRTVAPAATGA